MNQNLIILSFIIFFIFGNPWGFCISAAEKYDQSINQQIEEMKTGHPDKYKDFQYALRYIRTVNRNQKMLTSLYVAKAVIDHAHWERYKFQSAEHRLNFLSVLMGIIRVESGFNPGAVSCKNARGLMQVHWPTWKRYFSSPQDAHNTKKNLSIGTGILRLYMQQSHNDLRQALYKYLGARDDAYADKVIAGAIAFKKSVLRHPIDDVAEDHADETEDIK